jgi:hypothetical protein
MRLNLFRMKSSVKRIRGSFILHVKYHMATLLAD